MHPSDETAGIVILSWKPIDPPRNTLRGWLDVELRRTGLVIHDCGLHRHANGRLWISLPGKPVLGADGRVQLDERGKRRFAVVAEWRDRATSDRFSEAGIEALRKAYPAALGELA